MFITNQQMASLTTLLFFLLGDSLSVSSAFSFVPLTAKPRRLSSSTEANWYLPSIRSSRSFCRSAVTDESLEEIEWDEDEFDFDCVDRYEDYHEKLKELARNTLRDPTAVGKSQQVFDDMYQAYIMTEDASLWPDTDIYNLMIEIHAYSEDPDGAEHAETILRRMEDESTVSTVARPNLESYAKVMEAWMRRKRLDKVEAIFEQLKTSENPELTANIRIYNKMIKAYGIAGDSDKAESILDELLEAAEDEAENNPDLILPNQKTWIQVMRAYGGPKHRGGAGVDKIQSLLGRMGKGFRTGHEDWKPNAVAFNALLQALSHERRSAKEAEVILYDMISQYRAGDEDMRPNADSFYHVINAYRGNTDAGVPFKIEKLLELQDALAVGSDDDCWKPAAKTFMAAMMVVSRTRDPKKALKVKRFMDRIKERYDDTGDLSFAPSITAYKSLLNTCAYTNTNDPKIKMATFRIALHALNELRESDDLTPGSQVYGFFLRACGNLMPPNRKRDAVIENVFKKCCKDGFLSDDVLREFERAASDELQLKILGGFLEDGVEPPADWSRNVKDL